MKSYMSFMYAALMLSESVNTEQRSRYIPNLEEDKKAKERHQNNLLKKGVKEFIIEGKTYFARDYKNAYRKHLKDTR